MRAPSRARLAQQAVVALLAAALAGCAVGPDFKPPAAPATGRYTSQPLPAHTAGAPGVPAAGGEAQNFRSGADIAADWWRLFRSPALDTLIAASLKASPTLQAERAALRQADELLRAGRGVYFPGAQVAYTPSRQQNATGTLAPTLSDNQSLFTLQTAQVQVSYALDVFGANRRAVESLQAQADAQRYELQAAYVTLTSNIVTAAVQEAATRAAIEATLDVVHEERESRDILQRQYELGSVPMTAVMTQDAALAATQASVPPLRKQLQAQRHLLAVLAGRLTSQEPAQKFELGDFILPTQLPVSIPARMVRQRPDVLQAQALLHAASAQVGVAIADMLPQVNLTAAIGGAATSLGEIFAPGNVFWSAGASLSQTLFAGGALWHHKLAADAALDEAGAQYRAVVLNAFQNVADSLSALALDADAFEAQQRAAQAAAQALQAARSNLTLGEASYLDVLGTQQLYEQARLNLSQARANRLTDTAALFQALGGGWWNRTDEDLPR